MCGIVGITGHFPVAQALVEGLQRLEYRGYDSAGIATISSGALQRRRAPGKLSALMEVMAQSPLPGECGIGHTRWATHGAPNEINAHPHATPKVAAAHNGIIENFAELRAQLQKEGYSFHSQTDSEVIPVLITALLDKGHTPQSAAAAAIPMLEGAFAFALIFTDAPGMLICARHGAPLVIGHGQDFMALASDAVALAQLTTQVTYLEDGDWAVLQPQSCIIYDKDGTEITRPIATASAETIAIGKGNYAHFMLKEIYEQPAVVAETLSTYYDAEAQRFALPSLPLAAESIRRVHLMACGTSYYAGLVARYWLESIARVSADVEFASEFRYRQPLLGEQALAVAISQSGETADTLAAMRYARQQQVPTVAIVNASASTMAREADAVLRMLAGVEIGVASTKAFTAQLAVLACLTLHLAEAQRSISDKELKTLSHALLTLPSLLAQALELDTQIRAIAETLAQARDVLYLGRGTSYALAHEGALKLKEISYIHAEAYAAGEMKHGPIALIDNTVPVIAIAPSDALFGKTLSNLQEAAARGGRIIAMTDADGEAALKPIAESILLLPKAHPFVTPMLYAIPIQLLAYNTARCKGTDIDQPRNLAKSVTVE